jgi:hypothetical protein
MSKYSEYEYRKQPGFDMNAFEGANQAIPMKALVIHCLDPRADEIPQPTLSTTLPSRQRRFSWCGESFRVNYRP